jgi:LacI family transcriptional regulator
MSQKVTIKEVAKHAGVAAMTVSRVLNKSGYVSQSVVDRVESAVTELGYVPNQLARSLRSKRTGSLALILTDITNPFFTTIARGAEDAASESSNLVLFCNTDENEDEEVRYMRALIEKRVDGVVLVPSHAGERSLELAASHGIPVVVIDREVSRTNVDVVRCESEKGTAELAKLLLDLGHRHFAVLTGRHGVSTSEGRVQIFGQTVQGFSPECTIAVHYGEFTVPSGREGVRAALGAKQRPTAVFATNNFISIGALQELRELGVSVPEEMALVGFDDLPLQLVSFPFLTVVSQPAYDMGRKAIELLLARINEPGKPFETILLPTDLIVRRSSGDHI